VAKEQEFDLTVRKPANAGPWLIAIFGTQMVLLLTFFFIQ